MARRSTDPEGVVLVEELRNIVQGLTERVDFPAAQLPEAPDDGNWEPLISAFCKFSEHSGLGTLNCSLAGGKLLLRAQCIDLQSRLVAIKHFCRSMLQKWKRLQQQIKECFDHFVDKLSKDEWYVLLTMLISRM